MDDRSWNKKILDYEIETCSPVVFAWNGLCWNKKILDYEIETTPTPSQTAEERQVEIRRFSITRLKRFAKSSKVSCILVEIRRFSITRLKLEDNTSACWWSEF